MAQPAPSEAPRYASIPFDDPTADLILRTSDGVDFRVFRVILRLASPVFASMLEVGQAPPVAADRSQTGSDDLRDGCPVVPVQEDSTTLDSLLRIVYPMKDPAFGDLLSLHPVVAAALKYEMEEAVMLGSATLLSFVPKEPLSVWAIAVRNGFETEARAAADEMMRQKLPVLDTFPTEMQDITAGAYYRLLQYRRLEGKVEDTFEFRFPPIPSPSPALASLPVADSSPQSRVQTFTDVICRSSDMREFPAHKAFLAFASPVMAAMLTSLPAASRMNDETAGSASPEACDVPILTFEEDGITLKAVIDLCRPIADRDVPKFLELPTLDDALKKYGMDVAMEVLQRQWSQLVASDPLRAYLIAANRKSSSQMRETAVRLLDRTMEDYYVPIVEVSPASMYRGALLYHRACKAAASDVAQAVRSWLTGGRPEITLVVPRKSAQCTGYTTPNRYYGCNGYSSSDVYPAVPSNVCSQCLFQGDSIIQTCRRLESPSNALFATLESLKDSPLSSDKIVGLFSSERDQSAMQTLYKTLYDKVIDKAHQAYSNYIEVQA